MKWFWVLLHFYRRRVFEPHPGRFSLEPSTVFRYFYISNIRDLPRLMCQVWDSHSQIPFPQVLLPSGISMHASCIFSSVPSLPLPLSWFGTWLVQFVDYLVCSISTMEPHSWSTSAAVIYFFFPTLSSHSLISEPLPVIWQQIALPCASKAKSAFGCRRWRLAWQRRNDGFFHVCCY